VYDHRFFEEMEIQALQSAREVVPLVLTLVKPRSVIDLGCGTGAWLAVFRENGVHRVRGVDGDWVERKRLLFPESDFAAADLGTPIRIDGSFDLAVSVEVAEHLDPEAGDRVVGALTALAPVVLFSAGIPDQGGVHHTNEQWPSYWIERFQARGFVAVDCLRPKLWENNRVAGYYTQNLFLFVRREHLPSVPALQIACGNLGVPPRNLVHPELWQEVHSRHRRAEVRILELENHCRLLLNMTPGYVSLRKALLALPSLAIHAIRRRVSRV
jgi:SAM-dependent methyltransferase